jgi:predicted Zn finger-like uncharacterized protein
MPEQIRCPSCDAPLRVPETLLGKNVKCPKCQKTFLAELEESADLEVVDDEPAPRRRPPVRDEDEEEEPARPKRRPAARDEEEYEEEEGAQEEEERPRRRRRGRRRAEAESAVAGPAISLIILGSLDILLVIANLIMSLAGVTFAPAGPGKAGGPGADVAFLTSKAYLIPSSVLQLCFAVSILMGGIKMKQLQSFGLAMTASILALLPCGNCCCIGLPLGIWALVVLNKPDVKNSFS